MSRLMEPYRCLPTRIGWAHRLPHYGCPKEETWDGLPPRGSLPWDDPDHDVLADWEYWLQRRVPGAHDPGSLLEIHPGVWDLLHDHTGRDARPDLSPLVPFAGLPVVVDDTLPPMVWRLVGRDGEVFHEGTFEP